jgi:hypothetical protein
MRAETDNGHRDGRSENNYREVYPSACSLFGLNITAGRSEFVYTLPMTGLPQGDSPLLLNTSYTITADIEVPQGGAEGMILTSGGRFAGYGFYLLKGKPVFLWNMVDLERIKWEGPEALSPGRQTVEFDFKYEGIGVGTLEYNNFSGLAQPGTGTLRVDGKDVAVKKMEKTLPMILQWDESFDIGADTLTGVNDADYQSPFPLTAKLNKLTIEVDRPQLSPEDIKKLQPCRGGIRISKNRTVFTTTGRERPPHTVGVGSRLVAARHAMGSHDAASVRFVISGWPCSRLGPADRENPCKFR